MNRNTVLPPGVGLLIVDDDRIDAEALSRALAAAGVDNRVTIAVDGDTALAMLRGEGGHAPATSCVVMLDLNLPGLHGIEVLQAMRDDPALSDTVVFVLTASAAQEDIDAAHDLDISGYMLKSEVGEDHCNCLDMLRYHREQRGQFG